MFSIPTLISCLIHLVWGWQYFRAGEWGIDRFTAYNFFMDWIVTSLLVGKFYLVNTKMWSEFCVMCRDVSRLSSAAPPSSPCHWYGPMSAVPGGSGPWKYAELRNVDVFNSYFLHCTLGSILIDSEVNLVFIDKQNTIDRARSPSDIMIWCGWEIINELLVGLWSERSDLWSERSTSIILSCSLHMLCHVDSAGRRGHRIPRNQGPNLSVTIATIWINQTGEWKAS